MNEPAQAASDAVQVACTSTKPSPQKSPTQKHLRRAIATSLLLTCLTLAAQERGYWRAASNNARTITGDNVTLADRKNLHQPSPSFR